MKLLQDIMFARFEHFNYDRSKFNIAHMRSKIITVVFLFIACATKAQSPLALQALDYTENSFDIPNPDRGFYRPQSYVVPVESESPPNLIDLSATIAGTTVAVQSRIVYMGFDLRNFSSNAPLTGMPIGPWGGTQPVYGTTQPLTSAALDYIRDALQQLRNSEAVAIVKFSYDGRGYTYNNRRGYDQFIHDCEPGAPKGREWYESGGEDKGIRKESDLCGIPGHEEKNWIQYHLWQLGNIFHEFEDVIMCVKGGFFGPWGEMHSSSYATSREANHWLLNLLLNYVPPSRSILVRAGDVMAWHNDEYGTNYNYTTIMPAPIRGSQAQRFGMFNDSYSLGGSTFTDQGALNKGIHIIGGEFNRNVSLTWIRNQNNFYGGETNTIGASSESNNIYPLFPTVPFEAAYAQTSHLNANYASGVHKYWGEFEYTEANITTPFTPPHDGKTRRAIFDPVYDGKNGMEFMRDRLGYRLVLREAKMSEWVEKNGTLEFEGKIQNVGFGNVVNKKNVIVILKSKENNTDTFDTLTNIDARDWLPDLNNRPDNTIAWRNLNFSVNMNSFNSPIPSGDYDIYLKINDPKEQSTNKRCIRFANKGNSWDENLGANLIGTTTVK